MKTSFISGRWVVPVVCATLIAFAPRLWANSTQGAWGPVENWPIVSVHEILLPTGKVMFYPYSDDPKLWDPATSQISNLPRFGYNIFCSGHSLTADGRVLVTGGHISNNHGLPNASYYDPFNNTITFLPNMNAGRWYPTSTVLGNGDIVVVSGDDENANNNNIPQVWEVGTGTWRTLSGAALNLPLYPKMFLAPNGKVFFAGNTSRYLDTSGSGSWSSVANRVVSGRDNYGSAAMYDDGKIVFIGGADPPTASAEVIDLNATTPSWRLVGSMAQPRRQHNATLLPDGTVLVTGGSSGSGFNDSSSPVLSAELWDPATETFTTLASHDPNVYRGYHSTAVLLPDGRVLSSGGDGHPTAEVFSPPYLFKGTRPSITSAPSAVSYGETFFVETPDGSSIAKVTWLRLSAVTHTHNMDQIINRLAFSVVSGGLNVTAPSSINSCPPGYYMLFILNGDGVPSVSRMLRVGGFSSPPPAPTGLTATAGASKVSLEWTASGTATSYKVKRSTTAGGPYTVIAADVLSTSYTDTAVTAGTTYYYVVSAVNPAGESADSNEASATPLAGGSGTGLNGDYYDNMDFTAYKLSRIDPTINFNWGSGSPDPSIAADTFSVRWTGKVEPLFSETYTFYTVTDDGVRLWVNGQLIIDKWVDQAPTEWSGSIALTAGQQYDIRMDYYENGGGAVAELYWSSPSTTKEIIPHTQLYPPASVPGAPTDLVATGRDGRVDLTWNAPSSGADSYNVKRSTTSGGSYTTIATGVTTTSYSDTSVVNGTTYYYVVSGVNSAGEGPNSNEASATPQPPPAAPTNLTATAGDSVVSLSWDAVTGADNYNVKRSTTAGGPYTTVGFNVAATSFTDNGVVNGTTYYYVVTAVNSAGESPNSNEASATPQAGTAPEPPTNLSASAAGKNKINLSWTQSTSSNITENKVYRSTTSGGPYSLVATLSATTSYQDAGLASKTTYYYVVTAVNASGESAFSNEASARTK